MTSFPALARIAVIGDYQPDNETHTSIKMSLEHTGIPFTAEWIPTAHVFRTKLQKFSGFWCAPGSPFQSFEGALAGIRFARENDIPFLGTCAGFQHAILEFARNVLFVEDAASAEYNKHAGHLFISRLACSLVGHSMKVHLETGSLAHAAYGTDTVSEHYYCNFGLNPAYEPALSSGGLRVSGRDDGGEARIIELPNRQFFLATLFVPQTSAARSTPHPAITAFAGAAARAASALEAGPGY